MTIPREPRTATLHASVRKIRFVLQMAFAMTIRHVPAANPIRSVSEAFVLPMTMNARSVMHHRHVLTKSATMRTMHVPNASRNRSVSIANATMLTTNAHSAKKIRSA